ncbi:MAG: DUF4340 domain-containing protein [Hyphomicrobiales bacterium]
MTPKLFFGLTVAAAASLAAAGVVYYNAQTWAPNTASGEALLPDLATRAGNVASVSVKTADNTVTVVKKGESWGIAERAGFPADSDEVREVVVGLTQMTIVEEKTRNPARYKLLDLDDPETEDSEAKLVTLSDADGKPIAQLVLGKVKFGVLGPGRNGTYVRKPGNPQTWLVSGDVAAPISVRGWAQKAVFEIPKEEVAQIKIVHADKEEVVLVRGEGEGEVSAFGILNLPEGAKIKQGADLAFIASSIAQLELWDVRQSEPADATAPGVVTSEIIAKNGLKVTVRLVSSKDEDHWVTVAAEGPEDAKAAVEEINARAKGWVFKVPSYKAQNFKKRRAELIDPPKTDGDS